MTAFAYARVRALSLAFACLLWASSASAQVDCTNGATAVSASVNITPAGSNRWGFVWITADTPAVQTCTVTWGGNPTTQVVGAISTGTGQFGAWFRTDTEPAASLASVAASGGGCSVQIIQAVACTGVDQVTPNDAAPTPVTENTTGTTATAVAITTVVGDVILGAVSINGKDVATVAPTSGTQIVEQDQSGGHYAGMVYLNGSGSSQAPAWSWTGNSRDSAIAFNVNAAGAPPPGCTGGLMLLGVGRACNER